MSNISLSIPSPLGLAPPEPDYTSPLFLQEHAKFCLKFFTQARSLPSSTLATGSSSSSSSLVLGMYHSYARDGTVHDKCIRHIVSSTRLVVQYAWALMHLSSSPDDDNNLPYIQFLETNLSWLRTGHYIPSTKGYAWTVQVTDEEQEQYSIDDGQNYTYAFSFSLLAYATLYNLFKFWENKSSNTTEGSVTNISSSSFTVPVIKYHTRIIDPVTKKSRIEKDQILTKETLLSWINETYSVMDTHLWESNSALYKDIVSSDWSITDPYRGQNANMHAVEAHLAAYEATGIINHLHRARVIARRLAYEIPRKHVRNTKTVGYHLIYEHYSIAWEPDFEFNKDKPDDVFKPWGFQPGHLLEWSKLLLQLDQYKSVRIHNNDDDDTKWRLPIAQYFFEAALKGWDKERKGGFVYSLVPDNSLSIANNDKYKWVQAEGIAASSYLAIAVQNSPTLPIPEYYDDTDNYVRTLLGDNIHQYTSDYYWKWYHRIWSYSWNSLIDHTYGSWLRLVDANNLPYEKENACKCPPGKVDYHCTSMCYDSIKNVQLKK